MKARIVLLAVTMAAMAPAYAGGSIADLADATGLTERQVLMLISNRTPYVEYRTSHSSALAQFKKALGKERAERLLAGETIYLERRTNGRIASLTDPNANPTP